MLASWLADQMLRSEVFNTKTKAKGLRVAKMARMTIAEVTAEVLRKWCGSDAERKPPIPPAQASASAPLPRAGTGLRRDLGPGGPSRRTGSTQVQGLH